MEKVYKILRDYLGADVGRRNAINRPVMVVMLVVLCTYYGSWTLPYTATSTSNAAGKCIMPSVKA